MARFLIADWVWYPWSSLKNVVRLLLVRPFYFDHKLAVVRRYLLHLTGPRLRSALRAYALP